MNDKRSPHFYLAIFWLLISIVTLCSGATPQRPYYSETPTPRHIQNNDRLTAEYFNNQLNVIYNWAQRTHTELDNLLHNGIGVASLTVGILNCTNKIINPEWDNLLHNGVGVASITVGLVKTNDLEISNKIDVPAIEFSGRSQPTPPVNNGMLYFDSDLQRFRVYQENAWRDLSSNFVINGTTLTNPLIIDGYLDTRNIYINENASISKNLNVQGNINSSGTTTVTSLNTDKVLKVPTSASTTLGVGSIYYDTTAGKLKAYNGTSWDIVGNDIAVDTSMSSSSTNPVQNKVIHSALTQLITNLTNYVDTTKNNILESVLLGYVSAVTQGQTNGTIRVTKNGSATDVAVKGLGSAAYANVASFSSNTHNHNSSYVSAIATGDNNGTIKVTKNGSASNVAVKGLGSAAYANVASFSAANHNHDSAYISAIATGTNGTIAVTKNGSTTNISVGGGGNGIVPSYEYPPNNPTPGQIYYNTSTKRINYYAPPFGWDNIGFTGKASETLRLDLGYNHFHIICKQIYNNYFHPKEQTISDVRCVLRIFTVSPYHKILLLTANVGDNYDGLIHKGIIATTTYGIEIDSDTYWDYVHPEVGSMLMESMCVYDTTYAVQYTSPGFFLGVDNSGEGNYPRYFVFDPCWPVLRGQRINFVVSYRYLFTFY